MDTALERIFVDCSVRRLQQLAGRIEDCLGRMTDEQVWGRGGENENSAANLVLHLCGNLGQWIVSGVGGASDTRRRDEEFAARQGPGVRELSQKLHARVAEAAAVIERIPAGRLAERVSVQNYNVTVLEAVYHVVEHFSQHTGQIIFIAKAATGQDLGYYAHLKSGAHGAVTP
ncbi:MAG TPA: DinB family protein [Bryobacteraceae bacterium]|nr:DinB family protein [Bryobacteraceae bacterium]